MSSMGAFLVSRQAMMAQSHAMGQISTNVANMTTIGYKRSETQFETLLSGIYPGKLDSFSAKPNDKRIADVQGVITQTARNYDVAVNGRGFIVTNTLRDGSGDWQYTRDGAFNGIAVRGTEDTDGDGNLDQSTLLTTYSGNYVMGWPVNEDGTFTEVNDFSSLEAIVISDNSLYPAQPTSEIAVNASLSIQGLSEQQLGLTVVDPNGDYQAVSLDFSRSLTGYWSVGGSVRDANTGQSVDVTVEPAELEFDGLGSMTVPNDRQLTLTVHWPDGDQQIAVDATRLSQYAGDGKVTVYDIEQNGRTEGRLNSTFFDEDGVLWGSYSNQGTRPLYKLPLATFPAPNNLAALNASFFSETSGSGEPVLAGSDSVVGVAQFIPGALENSNVDLADAFTKMITTQRAYSSASKVLTTADEMVQQARDLA